ncbi:hypothetical protein D3C73_1018380 [compost metagenome]
MHLHFQRAVADLGRERMGVAIAALGGIAHGQQKALVGARQVLQAGRARGREVQRLARQVKGFGVAFGHGFGVDQFIVRQQIRHARHGAIQRIAAGGQRIGLALRLQREVQQALGVVVGGAQDLPARHVLEGGRDTALQAHGARVDRLRVAIARQGRAIGAQQEHGFDHVARRLLERQRGQLRIVERALGHHARYRQRHLFANLVQAQLGHRAVAAPVGVQHAVGIQDGAFAPFDGYVHVSSPPASCAAVHTSAGLASGTRRRPAETVDGSGASRARSPRAGP